MRKPRFLGAPDAPVAFYHCTSRVVDRDFKLGELEREKFVELLRHYATFCGIRVVTYCVLSNHFHLLLKVPSRPTEPPSDEELFSRLEGFYSASAMTVIRQRWAARAQDPEQLRQYRDSFLGRMWNLSRFMQELKQVFSRWYNRRHDRQGTLWEERFGSVLVEGEGPALGAVAAYVDLNPVRAGLVKDPKEYRWCGYAAAVGGNAEQEEMLAGILGPGHEGLAEYRKWLYGEGAQEGISDEGTIVRRGFRREEVERVWAEGGKLSLAEALLCRVRYFVDGAALGTRGFVEGVFQRYRSQFGPRRKDGARPMRGIQGPRLYTLRALRLRPIG